jgi:hypothetical protein
MKSQLILMLGHAWRSKIMPMLFVPILFLLLAGGQTAHGEGATPQEPLPKPANISCQGEAEDTVVVWWKDNAVDETNYRLERKIGDGDWVEIATLTPDSRGVYSPYLDVGVDTSQPNHFYRLRSYRSSDDSFSEYSNLCNNRRFVTTDHFRIFYGLRGIDNCPKIDTNEACLADVNDGGMNAYVKLQQTALEGSLAAFNRLGFLEDAGAPPPGLDRIPINVVWCDLGLCFSAGQNIHAGISPFVMETPFDPLERTGDPIPWLAALHTAFHFQQARYHQLNDPDDRWIIEGQARAIQDKICIGEDRQTALCFDDFVTGYASYLGQVRSYLGNPDLPIIEASGGAALFWTYLMEQYGTSSPGDPTEAGLNLLIEFWQEALANPGSNGRDVLDQALANMGYSATFREAWKNFAVASYAKDITGSGVPGYYRYSDMAEPGGEYGPVLLSLSQDLGLEEQITGQDETIQPWGIRVYELRPSTEVPLIHLNFTQDIPDRISDQTLLYYTILGIRDNDLVYEHNLEARELNYSLVNAGYSKVVVIVAGLENRANFSYWIKGTQPTLQIISPTGENQARVGDPSEPGKFLLQLAVVDGQGDPLAGFDPAGFHFRIGSNDLAPQNILGKASLGGRQWFVLLANPQDSSGPYDLTVDYIGNFHNTIPSAISYIPRYEADNLILLDRSGSMGLEGKMNAAQDAARLYVDSWRWNDMIGVISYNQVPEIEMNLTAWTDTPDGGSRQDAFEAIDSLLVFGGSNIGDTLRMGWDELINRANPAHEWGMVLLSDGKEEDAIPVETFDQIISALANTPGKRPIVHSVAVGPDADQVRMQRLAQVTGGTYHAISLPEQIVNSTGRISVIDNLVLSLDSRYRAIATNILGHQQFFSQVGPLNDGIPEYDLLEIDLENGAAELILTLSWDPDAYFNKLDPNGIQLKDPGNILIPYAQKDAQHLVWRIASPAPGTWSLYIPISNTNDESGDRPSIQADPEYLPPYLLQAALETQVTLYTELTTPEDERTPGAPIGIIANLSDREPILNADVVATIQLPDHSITTLKLYDDGVHQDSLANDGIYANIFRRTGLHGAYDVNVNAQGLSSISGDFVRQTLFSFYINSLGDGDGDGLPDEWELRFGTNPEISDSSLDPDNDGLSTILEWQLGTSPTDSDTDDGGEADSSDPDPVDALDDSAQPVWSKAYPGINEVYLKYVNRPEWEYIGLFRSQNGIQGPYEYLGLVFGADLTGVYTDTMVANGTEVCYIIQAIDIDEHRTASPAPACATPAHDPAPPQGRLLINNGAARVTWPRVTLNLWATDSIDPHNLEQAFLPPAHSPSGVTEMQISNFADFHDAGWEPYRLNRSWTLPTKNGLAFVFVRFRDEAGNISDPVQAAIIVDPIDYFMPLMYR